MYLLLSAEGVRAAVVGLHAASGKAASNNNNAVYFIKNNGAYTSVQL